MLDALSAAAEVDRPMPIDVSPDDATLVAAARADPSAFGPLYTRYARPVYRYCCFRLGSHAEAEDATSEVFLKALAALPRYRDGSFAAWLFQIAHNVVQDMHRRRRPTEPVEVAAEVPDAELTPEDAALRHAEWTALRDALATLPEQQRRAVELQTAGWSLAQSAGALGTSPGAVKVLRYRALHRLRMLVPHPGRSTSQEVRDDTV